MPIIHAFAMGTFKHPQADCVDEMNLTISSINMEGTLRSASTPHRLRTTIVKQTERSNSVSKHSP